MKKPGENVCKYVFKSISFSVPNICEAPYASIEKH